MTWLNPGIAKLKNAYEENLSNSSDNFRIVTFAQQINIPIRVTDGAASDTVRFGLDPTATDGIDPSLNEFELPPSPPSGIFDARFVGDGIGIPIGQE